MIAIENINSRFLALVGEFLIVQNAYFECSGFNFTNVGYLGADGKSVDSGGSPESVKDLALRAKYIERIAQNGENSRTAEKIAGIKGALLKSLRETVDMMDEADKVAAKTIVEELSSLKK